jgi:DNA (cytosine-5)-methyltransferase 1
MRYLSVCSGIEAATVAWHPLGWTPAAFSEIDPFPRAVLAHHYPDTPLHGDFTTIEGHEYGPIDLLVGGTPCQDFSVAGLRAGIAGDRGNLTLEYLRLAARTQPRWIVWENVPGVLSSDDGRALGSFLGGLGELGYGFAYRVLDAQYAGVPQRRRRVFVVGYLGDWRRAAAVLFERESLLGHPAPRREAGEGVACPITPGSPNGSGYRNDADTADNLIVAAEVAPTLVANGNKTGGIRPPGTDGDTVTSLIVMASGQSNAPVFENDQCPALTCLHEAPIIAHTLRGNGHDASEDGTGRGVPLVPVAFSIMPMNSGKDYKARETDIAQPIMAGGPVGGNQGGDFIVEPVPFDTTQITSKANYSKPKAGDPCHPLAAGAHPPAIAFEWQRGATQNLDMHEDFSPALIKSQTPAVSYSIRSDAMREGIAKTPSADAEGRVRLRDPGLGITTELAPTIDTGAAHAVAFDLRGREGGAQFEGPHETANIRAASGGSSRSYIAATAVRRLTPTECERLQGFPDDYTLVPYRGKPASDGPRYKALGNSMAVPCMAWIGQRIAMIETLIAA